MERNNFLAT